MLCSQIATTKTRCHVLSRTYAIRCVPYWIALPLHCCSRPEWQRKLISEATAALTDAVARKEVWA